MGDVGEAFDVDDVEFRIADRLGIDRLGPLVDRRLDAVIVGSVNEMELDAEPRQRVVKQVVRSAV